MSLKKLEEFVTKDNLDFFERLGGVPPIGYLGQNGVKRVKSNKTAQVHIRRTHL